MELQFERRMLKLYVRVLLLERIKKNEVLEWFVGGGVEMKLEREDL